MADDSSQESLKRIAEALDQLAKSHKEEIEASAETAEEDRRRERAALLTIGFTLILIVLSASNVASRVAPFAGQLKDYGPLIAVGVTIMAAMVYRAFQVRAIPLELVIGTCMGIMIAAALTLLGANVQNGWVALPILTVAILVALALFDAIKWDFGRAERAAIISTILVLLILWATGLIRVTLGGHNWLKVEFVGQTLMTVDSSFPLLAALDLLTATVCGLLLAILYWRWSAFQEFVLQAAPSSDDETVAQSDGQKRFRESLLRLAPSFVSKTAGRAKTMGVITIWIGAMAFVMSWLVSANPWAPLVHR